MVGWHHRLNEHEFGQILGDSEGQRNLVCCSPWSHKELDMTWRLNNNNIGKDNMIMIHLLLKLKEKS